MCSFVLNGRLIANIFVEEVIINIDDFKLFELEESLKKELTLRQLRIVELLRDGYHYSEISEEMDISLATFYRERNEIIQKIRSILSEHSDYEWNIDATDLFRGGEIEP